MEWFKRLFCVHEYAYEPIWLTHDGKTQIICKKCVKCGKIKLS